MAKEMNEVNAAKAEAEKILAEAKAEAAAIKAKAMEEKAVEAKADDDNELVPVRLFKDNERYKDDVFVAVNGERCQIKRGETVMIKRKFAKVLDESYAQDMATARLIEQESSDFAAKAKALDL